MYGGYSGVTASLKRKDARGDVMAAILPNIAVISIFQQQVATSVLMRLSHSIENLTSLLFFC